jgi:hypothetical protein
MQELPLRHWIERPGSRMGPIGSIRAAVDLLIIGYRLRRAR